MSKYNTINYDCITIDVPSVMVLKTILYFYLVNYTLQPNLSLFATRWTLQHPIHIGIGNLMQ